MNNENKKIFKIIHEIRRRIKLPRINKEEAKAILNNVPEDKIFWVNDGKVLRNIKDLKAELAGMTDDTFRYHVNKERNDFMNWINEVVGDNKLARDISRTKNKKVMTTKISRRISQLTKLVK